MRINRTLGLALTAAVLAVAMTGCSNSASSTASSAASSEAASSVAASSVAASSEAAESEVAAASVVSTEDLDVNGTTYSADCYGEFTLSNGDTMKLWKVKDAYAGLSALPVKGMAEEFPIEAEAEQIYVADVTSNGETTRQYLRTDKAGRNGTVSVKTFELGAAEYSRFPVRLADNKPRTFCKARGLCCFIVRCCWSRTGHPARWKRPDAGSWQQIPPAPVWAER